MTSRRSRPGNKSAAPVGPERRYENGRCLVFVRLGNCLDSLCRNQRQRCELAHADSNKPRRETKEPA